MTNPPVQREEDALGEFVVYTTEDERTEVHLRLREGTVWMTQEEMALLFDVSVATISRHLRNVYEEGEITRDRTLTKFERVQSEGDRDITRLLNHYNLDAIIAVGYRVRGPRGIQFRTWATSVLKEYLIKGFVLNDEKLKDPRGADYFDELLERIRDIRSSERRFYAEVRELFSLAEDYDPKSEKSKTFFAAIQNKLHYAITGLTASEIIATRCDPHADNLGLTSFRGKKVRKGDITSAKNYLLPDELENLNLLVSQFLDYAESQAKRRKVVRLADWMQKTDDFIAFNEYEPLQDRGRISMTEAKRLAGERYTIYDSRRRAKENDAIESQIIDELKHIESRILRDRARLQPRTLDQ